MKADLLTREYFLASGLGLVFKLSIARRYMQPTLSYFLKVFSGHVRCYCLCCAGAKLKNPIVGKTIVLMVVPTVSNAGSASGVHERSAIRTRRPIREFRRLGSHDPARFLLKSAHREIANVPQLHCHEYDDEPTPNHRPAPRRFPSGFEARSKRRQFHCRLQFGRRVPKIIEGLVEGLPHTSAFKFRA